MSSNHSEEEENPIQPPIDSESWCRSVTVPSPGEMVMVVVMTTVLFVQDQSE